MLDTVPEGLELGAVEGCLARTNRTAFVRVLDIEWSSELAQNRGDCNLLLREFFRYYALVVVECLAKGILYPTITVNETYHPQVIPQDLGCLKAQQGHPSVRASNLDRRELVYLHNAKANSRVGFDLLL